MGDIQISPHFDRDTVECTAYAWRRDVDSKQSGTVYLFGAGRRTAPCYSLLSTIVYKKQIKSSFSAKDLRLWVNSLFLRIDYTVSVSVRHNNMSALPGFDDTFSSVLGKIATQPHTLILYTFYDSKFINTDRLWKRVKQYSGAWKSFPIIYWFLPLSLFLSLKSIWMVIYLHTL